MPNGAGLRRRVARRRAHRRGRPSRSAPSRRAPSSRSSCGTPTSRCCCAATSYRGRGLPRRAAPKPCPSSTSRSRPPLLAPSAPALRRVVFVGARPGVATEWTIDALWRTGAGGRRRRPCRRGAAVRPSDRMVIVHTSGSTSEPKGRDPPARHRSSVTLDNLNELRRYTEDDVLFSNSPFFWIGGLAYGLLGTLLAGATLVCSNATDRVGDARPHRACASDDGATASRRRSRTWRRTRRSRHRDLSSIRRGQPVADHAGRRAPGRPRAAPQHARHDRDRQRVPRERGRVATSPSTAEDRSAGRCPGFEARIVDPDTGTDCETGRGRRAVVARSVPHGGVLRARAPRDVHARRLVPHRRPVPLRRRGLLLLHRPARAT